MEDTNHRYGIYIHIPAICDNDTVILDGAFATSVVWDSFFPINYTKNFSYARKAALYLMSYNFLLFIISLPFFAFSPLRPVLIIGVILLFTFVAVWLRAPKLVKLAYGGKFSSQRAAMFGVEGYINAVTVEKSLFGGVFGRMAWPINVSPNMEVKLFEAVNPTISFFLCASEGGMQRLIGCSYDWTTQTMYRETVLRLPTATLEFMYRVHRVKIEMRKPQWPYRHKDNDTNMV